MIKYVVGFYFNPDLTKIALIRKERPFWQKGKLNGIGGKIEENEGVLSAMAREFKEETGLVTEPSDWELFCTLSGNEGDEVPSTVSWQVYFCRMVGEDISKLKTQQDEEVVTYFVSAIPDLKTIIPNLRWLVPMALESPQICYEVQEFAY